MTGCKIRVRSRVASSRLRKRNDKTRLSQSKCGFLAAIRQNVGEKKINQNLKISFKIRSVLLVRRC